MFEVRPCSVGTKGTAKIGKGIKHDF